MISKDEIIRMAREAGLHIGANDMRSALFWYPEIERFASLVAAHTQEQCAKVCDEVGNGYNDQTTAENCAYQIRAMK